MIVNPDDRRVSVHDGKSPIKGYRVGKELTPGQMMYCRWPGQLGYTLTREMAHVFARWEDARAELANWTYARIIPVRVRARRMVGASASQPSASDLDRLAAMDSVATPGPWQVECEDGVPFLAAADRAYATIARYGVNNDRNVEDFEFLAALRNAAPALIAELRRLREVERVVRDYGYARERARQWSGQSYRDQQRIDAEDALAETEVAVREIADKLAEADCICGEINARNCPVHQ